MRQRFRLRSPHSVFAKMPPSQKPPSTEQALRLWLQALHANGAASDTLEAYERDLRHLIACYAVDSPLRYDRTHLQFALEELHATGLQPRSLARMLSAWRNFFNWLSEEYQTGYNPCLGVKAPKGNFPEPKILSLEHIQQLLDCAPAPTESTAVDLRDQAIFELLYSSGLRLAEIIALDLEPIKSSLYESKAWIDWAEHEVQIATKEERQRSVPIGSKALEALQHWLARRAELLPEALLHDPEQDLDSFSAVFLGVRGQRISARVIQKQLELRAKKVGLDIRVFPHRLRNSFANHLLESSNDLQGVQQLMGHAVPESTTTLKQLNPEQLAQFLRAHPRHNKTKDN